MKKLLSLILILATIFLTVGCVVSPEENEKMSRGTIDGNVYMNDVLQIKFTKPESWVYYTDAEIADLVDISVEMLEGDFEYAIENNVSVYDMMVADTSTNTNINVGYENLRKTFSSNITVEQYIEALKNQMGQVSSMTVTFPDTYDTVMLGKTEFTRVVCKTKMYTTNMTQVYYLRKVGACMAYIIVTITSGYTVDSIEAMFENYTAPESP
ncbi:MAG: hypothetical protein E7617_07705 [Ruminococcaceae bacterium]|nr:hypothetical protein [Oscillospiraceae bacterium]